MLITLSHHHSSKFITIHHHSSKFITIHLHGFPALKHLKDLKRRHRSSDRSSGFPSRQRLGRGHGEARSAGAIQGIREGQHALRQRGRQNG